MTRHPNPAAPDPAGLVPAPLAPAGRPAVLAVAAFALGFGIGLRQLARSNRPHELTAAPLVALLLAIAVTFAVLGLRRLSSAWREREEHPLTLGHLLLAVLLVPLAATGALIFLGAFDITLDNLAE